MNDSSDRTVHKSAAENQGTRQTQIPGPAWDALSQTDQAMLKQLIDEVHSTQILRSTPSDALSTALRSPDRQTVEMRQRTADGAASVSVSIQRTANGGLRITDNDVTKTWRRVSLLTGNFRELPFEPFQSVVDSRPQVGTASTPEPVQPSAPAFDLAADTEEEDSDQFELPSEFDDVEHPLDASRVLLRASRQVELFVGTQTPVDRGFAVVETSWDEQDGEPVIHRMVVNLVRDDDERCLTGVCQPQWPDSDRSYPVTLVVRPLRWADLDRLGFGDRSLPSETIEFLALEQNLTRHDFNQVDGGWESGELPNDTGETNAALIVSTGSERCLDSTTAPGSTQGAPDDPPDTSGMSTDTLLRRYHETDDERYFAAGDGWPKLQGQLELMVKNLTGGDQDLAREVVQETAAKFLKKHREKSFTSTDRLGGLCYQTCCNLLRDHWRKQSRQKTEKTDPGILAGTISQSSRPALLPESAWEFLSPEALSSLPAEEQIYVELKQVTRSDKSKTPLSDHVIAQLMGTTRNRIQRIHKRAVDGLQRLLSESDEFDMDELKAWFLDSESPGVERA